MVLLIQKKVTKLCRNKLAKLRRCANQISFGLTNHIPKYEIYPKKEKIVNYPFNKVKFASDAITRNLIISHM